MAKNTCKDCGKTYERISQHWAVSSCTAPRLSRKQKEIVTGMLMRDGCISQRGHIVVNMTTPEYLKYVDEQFPVLGSGVSFALTAEESAQQKRETGFSPDAKSENYSDMYRWRTICHPYFHEMRKWYKSESKVWPEDLELTPTVLKHWYCGDGNYDKSSKRVRIALHNERENKEKINGYFKSSGLPEPNWVESDRGTYIYFSVEESKKILKYMGKLVPGFEYKWGDDYRP